MGRVKILRHPRLVDTIFVVVVTVAAEVLITSDFCVVCFLVNSKTFSGARSTGVSVTVAPETGHISFRVSSSLNLEELSPSPLDDSKCANELLRDMVTEVLPLRSSGDFSSDATRAARTSGSSESHKSATDLGIVGATFSMGESSSLFESLRATPMELALLTVFTVIV